MLIPAAYPCFSFPVLSLGIAGVIILLARNVIKVKTWQRKRNIRNTARERKAGRDSSAGATDACARIMKNADVSARRVRLAYADVNQQRSSL
jgi:hypothetical protein